MNLKLDNLFSVWRSTVVGLECNFNQNNEFTLSYVVLKKKKKRVELVDKGLLNSPEELQQKVDTNSPVVISFSGKNLVHKSVPAQFDIEFNEALNLALPNSELSRFYVQKFRLASTGNLVISVTRNELIDSVLIKLSQLEYHVTGAYLGPFPVGIIAGLLPGNLHKEIGIHDFTFTLDNGEISHFKRSSILNNDEITIEGIKLDNHNIVPFALAVSGMVGSTDHTISNTFNLHSNKNNYYYKNLSGKIVSVSAAAIFLILMINFFLFKHYFDENAFLKEKARTSNSELEAFKHSEATTASRVSFMKENNFFNGYKVSFYADRIVSKKPDGIRLNSLSVFPLKSKITDNNQFEFNNSNILVSGSCKTGFLLTNWMDELKKFEWIETIEVLNFHQSRTDSDPDFNIKINLEKQ